ncbi:MAG: tetratricopeptide repeat protein [Deltaproteobacteria bacterium]|nr:tetratricopeptide repeat protein [Deltaproteobacteria bacterium]MBW2084980.1 tetratricopeptide repeat protein [Deltaproteobacteria bacterium]
MIKDVLEGMNVREVTLAENGLAALKRIQRNPNYFLLADWDLPQVSGFKLLRELRLNKESASMSCVLIITDLSRKELDEARSLNVTGFLKKPVSPRVLQDKIMEVLGLKDETPRPETLLDDADELLESGQAEEALGVYRQAVKSGLTHLAKLHTDMGLALKQQGRLEEAIASLKQAVEVNPESTRSHSALGKVYLSAGRAEEAKSSLKQALNLDPENHENQISLADSYLQLEENSRAEEIYTKVLQHRPDDLNVFNRLGIAFRKQGKYEQALANYHQALKITSQDENLYFNLGRCYFEMGRLEEARGCMQKALAVNPDFEEAKEFMTKI